MKDNAAGTNANKINDEVSRNVVQDSNNLVPAGSLTSEVTNEAEDNSESINDGNLMIHNKTITSGNDEVSINKGSKKRRVRPPGSKNKKTTTVQQENITYLRVL